MSPRASITFGPLLKQLRKRAGMTQADLAAAVGYSIPFISNLELNQRLPDVQMVMQTFVPALGLQDDTQTAAHLIERAAMARGERSPASIISQKSFVPHPQELGWDKTFLESYITQQRVIQVLVQAEIEERVSTLPTPPTELIGRSAEVKQLCNRLLGHRGRLLTLLGPPGIGKTTLALAVAAHLHDHYADGVVFVPLAAISDPPVMAATILAAIGSRDTSPKPPQIKLIEFLRLKTMLVVLDNFEQLLSPPLSGEGSGVGLVATLVAECPGVCILTTSRERLHLRAEQRFNVPPLDLAPAVDLFVQRAQAVAVDFSLTPHNQPTLAAICQRLDCLPLAIELCAAQVDLLSLAQLLAHLQAHRLDMLVDGAHDLPPRQRTLRTAIGHSYALLADAERLLLRSLGIFMGGFDLAAVEVVSGQEQKTGTPTLLSTLHALIGKSLVRAETLSTGEPRFLLLETIREFALEQARVHGEEGILRQRHYVAYLQRFRTADSHLRGVEATTWVARMEPDQDNLRAALQWTLDEARYADAAWLMVAVHYLWFLRGSRYEGAQWLAQLLPHRQTLATDLRLATLICFYVTAFEVEEIPPVDHYRGEVMALLEVCADKLLRAAAWIWLATATSNVAQAARLFEQCVALTRAASEAPALGAEFCLFTDRDFILATSLDDYAENLIDQGEVARAAPVATESLALFRMRGNRYGITHSLGALGRLALLQGDLTQAQRLFHEVISIATAFNLRPTQVEWQPLLGIVTLYGGDAAEARRLLTESLRVYMELKSKFFLARVCTCLAELALWAGKIEQAEQWLAQSLEHQTDAQRITIFQVTRLWVAARLPTAQQQYPRAATIFGVAAQMHSQIHNAISGPMRALADAALATVRAALEPALFAAAFAAGQQMSVEEAFATILAPSSIARVIGKGANQ